MLQVLNEYTRECLTIAVGRSLTTDDVLEMLLGLFTRYGPPAYIRSDNGPELEEVLKREIFFPLTEAKVLIERWRREYYTIRPHSSLGYRPPAPEAIRLDPAFLNLPTLRGPPPQDQGLDIVRR